MGTPVWYNYVEGWWKMLKTYMYHIYPSKKQKLMIDQTLEIYKFSKGKVGIIYRWIKLIDSEYIRIGSRKYNWQKHSGG
jgi:hypothetical protein